LCADEELLGVRLNGLDALIDDLVVSSNIEHLLGCYLGILLSKR
jgi:hypothetical protein